MGKRILLTGATGYLGSHLAGALLDAGYSVVALKRRTSSLARLAPYLAGITLVDVEGRDFRKLFTDHGKVDAVIHAATMYGRKGECASEIADTNLAFPLKLLEAAAEADVPLFLNTGTALDKFLNAYAMSKAQFAEWGRLFAAQQKIRFVSLRLEHFFGPGDDDTKFTTHVLKGCLENVPELKLTPGEQKRDFIYIDDVVSAYLLLLKKQESIPGFFAEYDVGSGDAVTVRQFVELVHRLTGSRTHLDFGAHPYRAGEVMLSQADVAPLQQLGWRCNHTLEQGLKLAIKGCIQ